MVAALMGRGAPFPLQAIKLAVALGLAELLVYLAILCALAMRKHTERDLARV